MAGTTGSRSAALTAAAGNDDRTETRGAIASNCFVRWIITCFYAASRERAFVVFCVAPRRLAGHASRRFAAHFGNTSASRSASIRGSEIELDNPQVAACRRRSRRSIILHAHVGWSARRRRRLGEKRHRAAQFFDESTRDGRALGADARADAFSTSSRSPSRSDAGIARTRPDTMRRIIEDHVSSFALMTRGASRR